MKKDTKEITKEVELEYNLLLSMLKSAYIELRDMSKKTPKDSLSVMKVKTLNRILERIKILLSDEPSVDFLDLIDEDDIPSNSDALLIMSQYVGAIDNYWCKYHRLGEAMAHPTIR